MIKKTLKIVLNAIKVIMTLLIVFFVSFVLLQRLSNSNASLFGYRIFAVITGSMEPVYGIGDVILCKTVDTNTLKVGDDITYLGKEASFKDKVITHRIINIMNIKGVKKFQTQGVASNSPDPPIEADQIYGKVSKKMEILSFFHHYSSGSMGFFFFIVIPIMVLVGTEIVQTMLDKYQKKNAIESPSPENISVHEQIIANQNQVAQENQQGVNLQPTEAELQQELQALQQQVTQQQQQNVNQQPTEAELQQELQALQQQVAEQQQNNNNQNN